MRKALLAALLACSVLGCGKKDFHISGTITLGSSLRNKMPAANSVLFVVVKNKGGVPVAVKRIVNPQFPVAFDVGASDLLVPELRSRDALMIQVQMNTHGNLGAPVRGDFQGDHPDAVRQSQSNIHIVLDRQI